MSDGYYQQYLKRKELQKGTTQQKRKSPKILQLTDSQYLAYRWLVDVLLFPLLDSPTPDAVLDEIRANRFAILFKIARYFGIVSTSPQNDRQISSAIRLLVKQLQGKRIFPMQVSVEKIISGNRSDTLQLLVYFHQASNKISKPKDTAVELSSLSRWLINIGIVPPKGNHWFAPYNMYTFDDPSRNGELFRSLCVIFRPELYEPPPPPPKSGREMAERNRQALIILAEEGCILEDDISFADDIVKGNENCLISLLRSIRTEYQKRQTIALDALGPLYQ